MTPYQRSAEYYDAIYEEKDYTAEANRLRAWLSAHHPSATNFLEVGCGTGAFLATFRQWYTVAGVDLSAPMLEVARRKVSADSLTRADMRTMALGRNFDIVASLFSSIGYVRSPDELDQAVLRMAEHTTPSGLVVVEPWFTPEQWRPGRRVHGGLLLDRDDQKIVRMTLTSTRGRFAIMPMHHLVATLDGIQHFVEEHEMFLAKPDEYRAAFERAGLLDVDYHESVLPRGIWVGRKVEYI